MPEPGEVEQTIYSSIRGLVTAFIGPLALVGAGLLGAVLRGLSLVSAGLIVVGLTLLIGVMYDYPRHSVFSRDGITRVTFLRRDHILWDSIDHLARTNPFLIGRPFRSESGGRSEEPSPPRAAGLIAQSGRRTYLLTNAREGRAEYDRLMKLVTRSAPEIRVYASRPAIDAPPSNLYRRKI